MDILKSLKSNPAKEKLNNNNLIKVMQNDTLSTEQVEVVLGQWYHPLHYFPDFVSRLISISPNIAVKTMMSKIVWQELGEGSAECSHETIYINTMTDAGFKKDKISNAVPFQATETLVSSFKEATESDYLKSLGYIYATEAADLLMVSSIGASVRKATGLKRLPWVDIHVTQEPDHSDCVDAAVLEDLTSSESDKVLTSAEVMFGYWNDFFSEIDRSIA